MQTLRQLFPEVYLVEGKIATRNLAPGRSVYGERLARIGGVEYRPWDAFRSKLGGALVKGLQRMEIKPGASVLYLGAASGTTVSHISDVLGHRGVVYCVEFAPRCMRDLMKVCQARPNMIPLLEDARFPERYADAVGEYSKGRVDCIFEDVADPQQIRILEANAAMFLPKGGSALIAVKGRSISAVEDLQKVFKKVDSEIAAAGFTVEQSFPLEPFDKDHRFYSLAFQGK